MKRSAGKPLFEGAHQVKMVAELHVEKKKARNVLGWVRAGHAGKKPEVLVVGAHFDHLGLGGHRGSLAPDSQEPHNGADDNASGTAAILEIARLLQARRGELERDVLIAAFSGEESGLLGSAAFTRHPTGGLDLGATLAMINLDMVGRLREDKLQILGTASAAEWPELLQPLCERDKLECKMGGDGYGPSDQMSFYTVGIPVVHFFTGTHEDYHKPSDDLGKINAEGAARVADVVTDTLLALSRRPAKLTYVTATAPPPSGDARSFGAGLGTVPDYADDKPGVRISGTRPDSAAAKAGVQPGDRIVELGGAQIRNIYDYVYVLRNAKPGDKAKLIVVRGEQKVELEVVYDEAPPAELRSALPGSAGVSPASSPELRAGGTPALPGKAKSGRNQAHSVPDVRRRGAAAAVAGHRNAVAAHEFAVDPVAVVALVAAERQVGTAVQAGARRRRRGLEIAHQEVVVGVAAEGVGRAVRRRRYGIVAPEVVAVRRAVGDVHAGLAGEAHAEQEAGQEGSIQVPPQLTGATTGPITVTPAKAAGAGELEEIAERGAEVAGGHVVEDHGEGPAHADAEIAGGAGLAVDHHAVAGDQGGARRGGGGPGARTEQAGEAEPRRTKAAEEAMRFMEGLLVTWAGAPRRAPWRGLRPGSPWRLLRRAAARGPRHLVAERSKRSKRPLAWRKPPCSTPIGWAPALGNAEKNPSMRYRFAEFLLDLRRGSLAGPEGSVHLRPQAFRLLEVLVSRAPGMVPRDELLDRVWGTRHLSPGSLKQAISELRQALGDPHEAPRLIETVHRRGYRFIAAVGGGGAGRRPAAIGRGAVAARCRGSAGRRFAAGGSGAGSAALLVLGLVFVAWRVAERLAPGAGAGLGTAAGGGPFPLPGARRGRRRPRPRLGAHRARRAAGDRAGERRRRADLPAATRWPACAASWRSTRRRLSTPAAAGGSAPTSAATSCCRGALSFAGEEALLELEVVDAQSAAALFTGRFAGRRGDLAALARQAAGRLREELLPPALAEEAGGPRWAGADPAAALRLYATGLALLRGGELVAAARAAARRGRRRPRQRAGLPRPGAGPPGARLPGAGARRGAAGLRAFRAGCPGRSGSRSKASSTSRSATSPRRPRSTPRSTASSPTTSTTASSWPPRSPRAASRSRPPRCWRGCASCRRRAATIRRSTSRSPACSKPATCGGRSRRRAAAARKAAARGATGLVARARRDEGWLLGRLGPLEESLAALAEAEAMFRAAGDRGKVASVLATRAGVVASRGQRPEARRLYEEAARIAREIGNPGLEAQVLNNFAAMSGSDDVALTRALLHRSLELKVLAGRPGGRGADPAQPGEFRPLRRKARRGPGMDRGGPRALPPARRQNAHRLHLAHARRGAGQGRPAGRGRRRTTRRRSRRRARPATRPARRKRSSSWAWCSCAAATRKARWPACAKAGRSTRSSAWSTTRPFPSCRPATSCGPAASGKRRGSSTGSSPPGVRSSARSGSSACSTSGSPAGRPPARPPSRTLAAAARKLEARWLDSFSVFTGMRTVVCRRPPGCSPPPRWSTGWAPWCCPSSPSTSPARSTSPPPRSGLLLGACGIFGWPAPTSAASSATI